MRPKIREVLRKELADHVREEIRSRRLEVLELAVRFRTSNPRLLCSIGRSGRADAEMLVDYGPGCTLSDLAELELELEQLLGWKVDVRTPSEIHPRVRQAVIAASLPV